MPAEKPPSNNRTVDQMYRNILVPTDGSDGAQLALEHAIAIAKAFNGTIHAMSVDEGAGSTQRDQLRTDAEELAEKATEEAAQRAESNNVPVTISVQSGSAEQAIMRYAEETDIDLIVMGTHGRTGIKNIIFGSVAEDTVRNSPVPVMTVQPPEDVSE